MGLENTDFVVQAKQKYSLAYSFRNDSHRIRPHCCVRIVRDTDEV